MQGTRVQSLVQEEPTCCGATKAMHRNYWSLTPEPMLDNKRRHFNEEPVHRNEEQPSLATARESPQKAMKTP